MHAVTNGGLWSVQRAAWSVKRGAWSEDIRMTSDDNGEDGLAGLQRRGRGRGLELAKTSGSSGVMESVRDA